MSIQKAQGIVLLSRKVSDADRQISILTSTAGMQRFLVKGIAKSKKRSGWLLGGNLLDFHYYDYSGRDQKIIRDAEILYSPLAMNLDSRQYDILYHFLSLLQKHLRENEQETAIFPVLHGFIEHLPTLETLDLEKLYLFAQWRSLKSLGFLSWPLYCSECGDEIKHTFIALAPSWSSLGCRQCAQKSAVSVQLEGESFLFLVDSLRHKWDRVKERKLSQEQLSISKKLLQELWQRLHS